MTRSWLTIPSLVLSMAACDESSRDDSLQDDLDMAASPGIQLAPSGRNTTIISSVERSRDLPPAMARSKRVSAPHAVADPDAVGLVHTPAQSPSDHPTIVDSAPQPSAAPRPRPRNGAPGNDGRGYKTVDEVIRDAPFPINP